jgi:hypothetical protein
MSGKFIVFIASQSGCETTTYDQAAVACCSVSDPDGGGPQRGHSIWDMFNSERHLTAMALPGGPCPTIFRLGQRFISAPSTPSADGGRDVSIRWLGMCVRRCAWPPAYPRSQGRQSSTRAPCVPSKRAARAGARAYPEFIQGVSGRGHARPLARFADRTRRCGGRAAWRDIQDGIRDKARLTNIDQCYPGEATADAATTEGVTLHGVKLSEAKRGPVLLASRWRVEGSSAWTTRRCPRLVKVWGR